MTSDNLLLAALSLLILAAVAGVVLTEPGGAARMVRTGHHTARWLDAHDVPTDARGYRPAAPAALSAVETVPDAVSTFAPRTFA